MNSTPDPYSSYYSNLGEQKGLEWMVDDGAYQHATIANQTVTSSHLQPDQVWVSQQLQDLRTVRAHIDAKLRELQDLYQKKQETLARLRAFNATTATTTWNIPPHTTASTSSSIAPYVQTVTHPPPEYMAQSRAAEKAFGCETPRKGEVTLHRDTLEHTKKSHFCHCGKGYSRKDSLLRHAAIHASEKPYV